MKDPQSLKCKQKRLEISIKTNNLTAMNNKYFRKKKHAF